MVVLLLVLVDVVLLGPVGVLLLVVAALVVLVLVAAALRVVDVWSAAAALYGRSADEGCR